MILCKMSVLKRLFQDILSDILYRQTLLVNKSHLDAGIIFCPLGWPVLTLWTHNHGLITKIPKLHKSHFIDADCRQAILENGGIQEIINCLSRYTLSGVRFFIRTFS